MKKVLYKAATRGYANHGWLRTFHTFSFADYYNPSRINFGALRVINDDTVAGGKGFGAHPHNNMEIITIPLAGALEHRDNMGNHGVILSGDVQVMSAGKGIVHSEFNASASEDVKLFQIWVFPDKENVVPRYQQQSLDFMGHRNVLSQIVSPDPDDAGLWIHQQAWFHIGEFDKGTDFEYRLKKQDNGVFAMVIDGEFTVGNEKLYSRDGLGISQTDVVSFKAESDNARILLMEVPMIEV